MEIDLVGPSGEELGPHDRAEDGYQDADMDLSSDSEANLPLAKISSGNRTTLIPAAQRTRPSLKQMTTGGNLFRKNDNRRYGDLFFNPVKEAIVDSSEHTITPKNGHILRKLDLEIKEKYIRALQKLLFIRHPWVAIVKTC